VQGEPLGGGFYKARLSVKSKGKGKSGGLRIISHQEVIFHVDETTRNIARSNAHAALRKTVPLR
jgi:hypothetical protein